VSVPPSPRRRKVRLVRDEVPDDTTLVVRATPVTRADTATSIAEDAGLSAEIYVIELPDGSREVLYGVSVFAHRPGTDMSEVLARFPSAPSYLETTAGLLRAAGYPVYATGSNPDHYDVQLMTGITETGAQPAPDDLLRAATGIVDKAGGPRPSPSYAGPSSSAARSVATSPGFSRGTSR
jgi:hypothetical protein